VLLSGIDEASADGKLGGAIGMAIDCHKRGAMRPRHMNQGCTGRMGSGGSIGKNADMLVL
jgi:hypothetical protein